MPDNNIKITFPDQKELILPIINGVYDTKGLDSTKLYSSSGYFSFDPGFMSTASCCSQITYIDGDKGELMHRGYNIEDLANNCDFLEVVYLLLFGELPKLEEFQNFSKKINSHTLIHEEIHNILNGFIHASHPMAMMIGMFASLSGFYYEEDKIYDKLNQENIDLFCIRSVAKILTIVSAIYKKHIGQKFIYPQNNLSYSENFLRMMFKVEAEEYKFNKKFVNAINKILILHADHEQNASTSTVRLAGSSGANPYACISAGLASLWGPAHGGANEAVIEMLEEIGVVENIPNFIKKVQNKEAKLMGFGHRIYKNFDPRAVVLKKSADEILNDIDFNSNEKEFSENLRLLKIAKELEKIALNDEYFISRKLYPNVDFYSGLILKAIGIPTIMFTPIFALSRTSGWVAQWKEMINDGIKIGRPRQIYTGKTKRKFVYINNR